MEITVHITYFPTERQYGASLWLGDKMVDIDYLLYDYRAYALKAGAKLKEKYLKQEDGEEK